MIQISVDHLQYHHLYLLYIDEYYRLNAWDLTYIEWLDHYHKAEFIPGPGSTSRSNSFTAEHFLLFNDLYTALLFKLIFLDEYD